MVSTSSGWRYFDAAVTPVVRFGDQLQHSVRRPSWCHDHVCSLTRCDEEGRDGFRRFLQAAVAANDMKRLSLKVEGGVATSSAIDNPPALSGTRSRDERRHDLAVDQNVCAFTAEDHPGGAAAFGRFERALFVES